MLVRAAERDLDALRFMRDSDEISDEVFGFHVQQAVEKSLKAHLGLLGDAYLLTHNLETLLDLLDERGIQTEVFRAQVSYTPYAVEFRYEGVGSDSEPIDRELATRLAKMLQDEVQQRLAEAEGR
ncbi:MAG: HEPN domain-containing protein [Gemmatimonadota bacterium]|nr:HEPN domain-containing protein [Gemmatimonadota bacterium]